MLVLTQYVLKHVPSKVHQSKSPPPLHVIELGAGLGLAGLALAAMIPHGLDITLTDGDDKVIQTLERNVRRNKHLVEWPATTTLAVKTFVWGREFDPRWRHLFDLIICADVVYSREAHSALLETIRYLLAPHGECWLFASRRVGSLDDFVSLCRGATDLLRVEVVTDYLDDDPCISNLKSMNCCPVMVRIVKADRPQQNESNMFDEIVLRREKEALVAGSRARLRHKRATQLRDFLARRSRARMVERGAGASVESCADNKKTVKEVDVERLLFRPISVAGSSITVMWPTHLSGMSREESGMSKWLLQEDHLTSEFFGDKSVLFAGPFRFLPFILVHASVDARKVHILPNAVEEAIALETVCQQFRGAVKVKLTVRGKYDIVVAFDADATSFAKSSGMLILWRGDDGPRRKSPLMVDWFSIYNDGPVTVCQGKRVLRPLRHKIIPL